MNGLRDEFGKVAVLMGRAGLEAREAGDAGRRCGRPSERVAIRTR
jgi:hypothetical protein